MNDFIELRRIIAIVQRRWWLLVGITTLAFAAGYFYSQSQPKVYKATAAVMVGRFIQSNELKRDDIQVTEVLARNYADLATRQPVLNAVMENVGISGSWRKLSSSVSVDLVPNTNLLEIKAEYSSAEKARSIADEVARQLILLSPSGSQNQENEAGEQSIRQQLESLQIMIETGQERYIALQEELSAGLSEEESNKKLDELKSLGRLIADWQNNYAQLSAFVDTSRSQNRLTVVEPAQAASRPVRPQVFLISLVSGGIGLVLALIMISSLEVFDKTIKSLDGIEKDSGAIPLGVVVRTESENSKGKLLTNKDLFSPESESYRLIQSNIELTSGPSIKSLMVTSPELGEGKHVMAANLGIVMAQSGHKTIVVDADLRKPAQHILFEVAKSGGLAELLASPENDPGDYLKDTGIAHLQLLTIGDLTSHLVKPLSPQDIEHMVSKLSELKDVDIVIYSGPPAVGVADSLTLASQTDGVLLVIDAGRTTKNGVRDAVSNLRLAKSNLLGVVLTRVSSKSMMRFWQKRMYIPLVKSIRSQLTPLPQRKKPLTSREISAWGETLDPGKISDVLAKALILVGYAGAFRRSELISLDVEHLEFQDEKLIVTLPSSKNDAEGGLEQVAIPNGDDTKSCPVTALKSWLEMADISEGPVFRPLGKRQQALKRRMTLSTVAKVLKRVCHDLELTEEECATYAGHILRTGRDTADTGAGTEQMAPVAQALHFPAKAFRGYMRWLKTRLTN